ncbi:MAG: alpha-2-macroglobulin family protein [Dysgonomonas sp.]
MFTDRSIYRPGQTVYFKVIGVNAETGKDSYLLTNLNYTIKLFDANSQIVSEKSFKTNEFGSITGEFILPQNGLTGTYRIEVKGNNRSNAYLKVEEYKRPTFQITFDKITDTYTFGDKVILSGQAESFSGIKLQDANVDYDISKSSFWRFLGGKEDVENGSVKTDKNGKFQITFKIPENDNHNLPFWRNIYSFNVSASITDINGETQKGEYNFAVGDVSMTLDVDLSEKLSKESSDTINIIVKNLNGQEIKAVGNYFVYNVSDDNDSITTEVLLGVFTSGKQAELTERIKKLPSGNYNLKLKILCSNDKEVENETEFVLYSEKDKKPPVETDEWIIEKKIYFDESDPAEIILGVSSKNVTVLYEIQKDNKILSREQIKLSNENKTFKIPYKAEYGENVSVLFAYVINSEFFQNSIDINKKRTEKKLNLKFSVFRNKLLPGQKEEWRISVKDNKGNPVFAELLASMYDSSLDKIYPPNSWNLKTILNGYAYNEIQFDDMRYFRGMNDLIYFKSKQLEYTPFTFDRINWFGFYLGDMAFGIDHMPLFGRVAGVSIAANAPNPKARLRSTSDLQEVAEEAVPDMNGDTDNTQPQIRQNFNETAFFYPQLRTNEKGETIISFTAPESNTTWRFRALAYDKSLNVGELEQMVMTRKELMVTPNLPRFLREGDKTSISAKISNLSENGISGNVRIEFFNPVDEKIIDLNISNQNQQFTVDRDASTSAEWIFAVPADMDMIGCRIIADSETFSDGEQHIISILPNKMLVTESLPIHVNANQDRTFTFDKLINNKSNSLVNYRLTLEYASNPAWYAVQALPVLSNPANENVINWFASYYVNTLGSSIARQYPKVSSMIKAWKQQNESKESIVSKLQKNEELKTVLLEETPWVLEAKDEKEQADRLSLLFDINNTRQQTDVAVRKLKELQNSDGGWSWYKGFNSSRSMTQYLLYGFTELINLGAVEYPADVKIMQMNALKFIDNQIKEDFKNLKENNKNWEKESTLSTNQLEYLYVRSAYRDIPIDQEARTAERFYTSVAEKNWKELNLYERSLLAVLSIRNGNKELVNNIKASLREHATLNDELGMYWANNKSNVFMSLSAVSTHVFLMDAFKETGASAEEMDKLKQWLLKQKQTQLWESTHATIDAIYALLSTGTDWLSTDSSFNIKLGNKTIQPQKQDIGTGYFKQTWEKNEITPEMGKVEVENHNNTPSYGVLYWQYYEDINKIKGQNTVLSIDKKLFIEKNTEKGKTLAEIDENNSLKTGDKVTVRLTIRTDRDMDFVHLKDMRASCFEPIETLSGIKYQDKVLFYQSVKDASTNYYFDYLPKGTCVLEYSVYVNRTGEYSNGITTIQCMYAPEFVSHTEGSKIIVK